MIETIPILHRDDELVVVSKPAGIMVHPSREVSRHEPFVLRIVAEQVGGYLFPVHRLDRNTSGVLCFTLTREAARVMQQRLADERTRKEYVVLARGETPQRFVTDRPLTSDRGERRPARSEFERLATFFRCSLLLARITTGRRHQIRRHLGHLAHQVIGDSSYGKGRINRFFRDEYGLPRMALHARRLAVDHPRTGERLDIVDPLPEDLRSFLLRLPEVDREVIDGL